MLTASVCRALRRPPLLRRAASTTVSATAGLPASAAEYYAAAKAFADAEFAPHAAAWHAAHHFPVDALRAAARQGYAALYVRAESGGSGLSREEGVPVIEALAGADTSTTAYLTIHGMVCWMIDAFGSAAQRAQYLPPLLTMDAFASYCLTEPGAGSDAAALSTRAVRDGGDYVLSGSKAFISGGGRSDVYAVMARTGAAGSGASGISCFLVPRDAAGLSFGAQERKMGWHTQPTAAVHLDGVRVPASARLGAEGEGFRIAMRALNGGRLSIAACSLGAAATCLDAALAHVRVRRAFGRPLADNQALQFMLADMATRLTASRQLVHHAARLLDAGDAAAPATCAMAKRFATENACRVVDDALQLHGGYGYLVDYQVERYLRDVRVHQILEGSSEIMSVIVARSLLAE